MRSGSGSGLVVRDLVDALGADAVVTDSQELARYRGIAWGVATSRIPLARPVAQASVVVRPRSTADVQSVVRVARETGAPIVPYGAGTGVHAGAAPVEGSIVLDLGAMQTVHEINRADRLATVEPGVVLGDLDRMAASHGLMVGHDPWSQPIASVGGATSTNGVGYLAGKYGPMGAQVLGMEVVLGTGNLIRARPVPKSSTGPEIRHLFIGAEGVFGIITRLDVRLFPIPERRRLSGYVFDRFEAGLDAVMEMSAIQLQPSMIDYEEDRALAPPEAGNLVDRESLMYLAFEGFEEEVEAQVARADRICRHAGGAPMANEQVQYFWDTRHESAERYLEQRARDPDSLARRDRQWRSSTTYLNVTLRPSTILEYRHRVAAELKPTRIVVKDAGVWGIPELFSIRLEHLAPGTEQSDRELEAAMDLGLRVAQDLGGSMEYCHGVGLRLAHLMGDELGSGLEALREIKRALDPDWLLNPGKLAL